MEYPMGRLGYIDAQFEGFTAESCNDEGRVLGYENHHNRVLSELDQALFMKVEIRTLSRTRVACSKIEKRWRKRKTSTSPVECRIIGSMTRRGRSGILRECLHSLLGWWGVVNSVVPDTIESLSRERGDKNSRNFFNALSVNIILILNFS